MTSLSVIIPCHNEETTLPTLLERVLSQNISEFGLEKDIIVVDDGSTDRTGAIADEYAVRHPDRIRSLHSTPHRGKGWCVRLGFKAARGDIILIQDGDLEYSPEDYPDLVRPIFAGVAPVVYGSRWLAREMPISGTVYSLGGWIENRFLHIMFRTNISDIATGYKVFRKSVLDAIELECEGFEFCPEITAKLLNRSIPVVEIPIRYHPRTRREGKKIRWTDLMIGLYTIARVRILRL